MEAISLIGIDLGKRTFHLHGQDRHGKAVLYKKFARMQVLESLANLQCCTVVMEACAGAHYMARQIARFGHQVKLISPQFVKPFVKTNKNDFIDAEAICEAASRPTMRFVSAATEEQQTLVHTTALGNPLCVTASRHLTRSTHSCSNSVSACL